MNPENAQIKPLGSGLLNRARFLRGLFLVLLLFGPLLAWLIGGAFQLASARAQPPVGYKESGTREGSQAVQVEGRLEPRRFAELSLQQGRQVERVLVSEGEAVQAGQPLLLLDGAEQRQADVEAARLELLLARQRLDDLYRNANVALAQATLAVRRAEDARIAAADHLASLKRPKDPQRITQVRANLQLAEKQLIDAREDYRKARQRYDNKDSLIWYFISRTQFKKKFPLMEKGIAYRERRYWDAKEKLDDILAPIDPIDLAQAEARLASAEAILSQATKEQNKLSNGPDPDLVEQAQARLQLAQSSLSAALTTLEAETLRAPLTGEVLELSIHPSEWAASGERLLLIADLSDWLVETQELSEKDVAAIQLEQTLPVSIDAYPGVLFSGQVEQISQYALDQDGDVYYIVKTALAANNFELRWGMTARLLIDERP
jgi:multidrug efflux pump subunit AcrA (membrane-fusion protein)